MLLTLGVTALLGLVTADLRHWKNYYDGVFWYKQDQLYSGKFLDMDFCVLDEQQTHDLYSQIFQNEQWSDWGFHRLKDDFNTFIEAVMKIAGAVALTVSLFTLPVPEQAGSWTVLNSPWFVLLLLAAMVLAMLAAPYLVNRSDQYWVRWAENAKFTNRIFMFFYYIMQDRSRAMDVRLYRQDVACPSYYSSSNAFSPESQMARWCRGPVGLLQAASAAVSSLFVCGVYVFVCLKAWAGAFGVGSVTQYIGAVTALSQGFTSLLTTLGDMKNNGEFLKTTFAFLDLPNRMYLGSLTTEKRSDRQYEVEFKNVSFRYPGADSWALRHVSLKFQVGKRLAVVGMNGSGKTTFIKLLCRLYDPTEGEILLNGIDIRKYRYDDYLQIFSVVFQDFKLLAFPLGQNVAAGREYDKKRAEDCLEKAGFVLNPDKMTRGLDTCLYRDFDPKGVEISGGEAQKIALARALYKDAPFIILDEPTAALDPLAEAEVYEKFNEIAGDKTAVYISHRLSSCRFCDEILVFHEGNVVQKGSHEELLGQKEGKYYELWNAQAQYYH